MSIEFTTKDPYLNHWCSIVKLKIIHPVLSVIGSRLCDQHTSSGDVQLQRVPPTAMKGWKLHKKYRGDSRDWLPYSLAKQNERIICYYANINITSTSYDNYLVCSVSAAENSFDIEIKEFNDAEHLLTSIFLNV